MESARTRKTLDPTALITLDGFDIEVVIRGGIGVGRVRHTGVICRAFCALGARGCRTENQTRVGRGGQLYFGSCVERRAGLIQGLSEPWNILRVGRRLITRRVDCLHMLRWQPGLDLGPQRRDFQVWCRIGTCTRLRILGAVLFTGFSFPAEMEACHIRRR